jgi:hypothetical protein
MVRNRESWHGTLGGYMNTDAGARIVRPLTAITS